MARQDLERSEGYDMICQEPRLGEIQKLLNFEFRDFSIRGQSGQFYVWGRRGGFFLFAIGMRGCGKRLYALKMRFWWNPKMRPRELKYHKIWGKWPPFRTS